MSSLAKTLRRWYSTVRGLRRQCVTRLARVPAHGLAAGDQPAPSALGECPRADAIEELVGGTQLLARGGPPIGSLKPFAEEQVSAGELRREAGATESLDGRAIQTPRHPTGPRPRPTRARATATHPQR
jgi:hypothetical protein